MDSSLLIESLFLLLDLDSLLLLGAEPSRLVTLGNNIWVGLQVAAGLGFVIFVHELGHFLAAKTFGVRCDKFYVGFDVPISIGPIRFPKTLGKFQWGETEYGIGIIPLGGYVKMLGQDDDPRKAEDENSRIRIGEGDDAPLDPRSYPAKPVWQRMIIISAGVVMNLIFAVIMAGVAYRFGVPYTPTVVGGTYGGGPAWIAGLEEGDQVVRVGNMSEDFNELRYNDFATSVATYGFENGAGKLPIVVLRNNQRVELEANPTPKYHPDGFFFIGVSPPLTPVLGPTAFRDDSFLGATKPDLQPGDLVTAVNGEKLPIDPRFNEILGSEFTDQLQANWEQPVTVTLERKADESQTSPVEVTADLPAVPALTLGLGFEVGPIAVVRAGSLGEAAGLKVGDTIISVNGEPVRDALKLPSMVARLAGQSVTLKVRRGGASAEAVNPGGELGAASNEIELTLQNAKQASFDAIAPRSGELTLGGVGVAFSALPIVNSIDETLIGSDRQVQVGDELIQIQWIPDEADKMELAKEFTDDSFEPIELDSSFTVANFYNMLQSLPPTAQLSCVFRRDGIVSDPVTLTSRYAEGWYWHQRGVLLSPLMQVHRTDNVLTAASLGFWETTRRFKEVLNVLRLLFTGRLGLKGLGGPGQIAYAAASEANMGVARLLLFLTFLSANLAILNFLPIPALDGGHMVFLTAEAIRGKPVNEELQVRLTMAGVLCLLSLMAFVIIKDILWFAN